MINARVTNYNKDTSKDNSLFLVKHVCVCLVFGNSEKKIAPFNKIWDKNKFCRSFPFYNDVLYGVHFQDNFNNFPKLIFLNTYIYIYNMSI